MVLTPFLLRYSQTRHFAFARQAQIKPRKRLIGVYSQEIKEAVAIPCSFGGSMDKTAAAAERPVVIYNYSNFCSHISSFGGSCFSCPNSAHIFRV
jgi:hypothetical protein